MTKLLAIGGPLEGQWLQDFDMNTARFPLPVEVKFTEPPNPIDAQPIRVATYMKIVMADYDHGRGNDGHYPIKLIYCHDSLNPHDAEEALRDFLFKSFVRMSDPE